MRGRATIGLFATLLAFAVATPGAGAVTLQGARAKALSATQAERSRPGTILFGLPASLRPGTSIREAGRRPPPAGSTTRTMRRVLTVAGERAYFFYLDRGAYQSYQHAGRVVLVGARSGRVIRSRTLTFAPVINGRLPVFLRSREGYELPAYRVSAEPYAVAGAARAAAAGLGAFGGEAATSLRSAASETLVAARLAAEHSCSIVIGGRRSFSNGSIGSPSGAPIAPLLVYDPAGGLSLTSFVATQAVTRRGCRDIAIAISGDGYRSLTPPSVRTSITTSGVRMREQHVTATVLRSAIAANPSVTFKLMIDGPGSGAYIEALRSLSNVLVIATSSTASQTAFRYLPEKEVAGDLRRNPLRMRSDSSFFTTMLFGGAAFSASDAEVVHAAGEVAAGRAPSFLAYMIARAFQLSRPFDFTADLGQTQRLYTTFPVTPPGPLNRAPVAVAQSVTTPEDTAKPIVLGASDPDGDALTYSVGSPAHGTLTGTAPNLTYTPAANYNGPDSFTVSVSDGALISATVTISITVTPVDDPPVTTASGTLAYTEDDPPTPIAPALTVTDIDSANLTGATVQVTANHVAADDLLALPAQPGITAVFDAPTGTLTLSGSASVAAYEAALRAVTYANSSDDPGSAPRTVTFKARDAGGFGPSATRTITIAPVNDAPVLTTTATTLGFEEGDPATAVDPGIDLADPDSPIAGATVEITANFEPAEDVLALPAQPGLSASYDAGTGVLTITGTASAAAYEAALRAVTYANGDASPTASTRTVAFQVTDSAAAASNIATRGVAVGPVNDAPVVTTSGGSTAYTENAAAVVVDAGLTVSDVDDTNLEGATVEIEAGLQPGDNLTVTPGPLAFSYDAGTGILTLTGTASLAAYQTVLRSVSFNATTDDPTASRTIWFTVDDGALDSAIGAKTIAITPVNDPPVVATTAAPLSYPEDAGAIAADAGVTVADPDSAQLNQATVAITSNFVAAQDELAFATLGTITGSYDDTTGVLTLTGTASVANYQAALRTVTYANSSNAPDPPDRTLTFTVRDTANATSAAATRTITLGQSNDSATVTTTAGALPYAEGAAATAIDPGLTVNDPDDTNLEGATVQITAGLQSADELLFTNSFGVTGAGYDAGTGTLTLTGTASLASYESALRAVQYRHNGADPAGPKTVAFRADDGDGLGPAGTKTITIAPVNDAPTVTTSGGSATFTEGGAAVAVDPGVTVTDPDSTNLSGATVHVASPLGQDALSFTPQFGITSAGYDSGTGDLVLTGSATVAQYQTVLRSVLYANSSDNPTSPRIVSFTVTDSASAVSNTAMRNVVVVAVNDAPVVTTGAGATAYTENAAPVTVDGGVTVTDLDDTSLASAQVRIASGFDAGDQLTFTPAGGAGGAGSAYDGGTGVLTLAGPGTVADWQTVLRSVQFSSSNDNPALSKTIEFKVNDGDVDSNLATKAITVTRVNDAPVVTTTAAALAYTENAGAVAIDPGLTLTDPDSAQISSATVTVTSDFVALQDTLGFANQNGISGFYDNALGVLSLTGSASPAVYQTALRTVTYTNNSDAPAPLSRTIAFQAVDDLSAASNVAARAITITPTNDPPTAVDDAGTTDEDTALAVPATGVLANDTDPDPGDTKTVVALNGTGTLTQTLPSGASVTINADGSYTYNPLAAFQGLSTGQSASDSFTYTMADIANAQSTATVNITVNGVSDAPTAVADSFDAIGNTGLFVGMARPGTQAGKEIGGSVLANDTDPDTPAASLIAEPFSGRTTGNHGTITIETDGNFTYHPDPGFVGTDTHTYRVCDSGPTCNSSTVANATGTLSLPLTGQVWYVRNNEPAGGDGTSDTPFDTLAEAEASSGTADTVFVFDGANTTTNLDTGYAMNANERLIGESRPLAVDPDGVGALPVENLHPGTSGAQPTLTASNEDVIVLASDVLVDGIDVDPSGTGGGISGGAGTDAVTVQNVNVTDTGTAGTQPGIEMDGTTGVNQFTAVTVTNGGSATAIGVRINNADRVVFANTATNTIATNGAKALDAASTNLGSSRWDDITVTNSGTGAIRLSSTTGQPVLGDGAGTDLSLQTTTGATAALDIASSNTVTVDSGGTDTISAGGGPAVDIRNSNGSQYFFDSVSSSGSAGDGINLDTNLTAPFVVDAGTISGAAGIAFDVNGGGVGGGGVVYAGAINDGPGQSVEVTGRDGGGVTLSGNIADSADAGGGIVVSGNSAGTTTFSGVSKVLNTGASNAVALSANGNPANGHLVSFSNGGLDIDTTSGAGLSASNGTLTIGGTGNSIATGTGTGLNIDTAGITSGNVNFDSISSNGAANGIRLNSTGTAGRLIVSGTGGTCVAGNTAGCSGGEIRNGVGADDGGATPAGTGVVLRNTQNPSFTRMWIHDHSNYGIRGTSVAGFTMADSVINGSNGTTALTANKDGSARFEELTGTVNMTNTAISGGYFTNLMVDNTAGVLNATLDNVDSGTLDATGGDDAVQFEGIGTSDMNVDYRNSSFTTASGDLFQYIGDGTGGGDLDLTANTFTNNEPSVNTGGGGVALVAGAKGAATMDVLNNTLRDSLTNALTVIKSRDAAAGTNNLVANISNNTIGVAATANSGSIEGDGMEITTFGDGNATFNVTNNVVRQYNSSGMQFVAGSGVPDGGQFNLNISGNTVANPGTTPTITLLQGIRVDSGVDPADTFATCVNFGANSITGSSDAPTKDFRLVASQNTTMRQPGYGGGATDGVAFAAFAAGKIGGGAQGTAAANAPATFSGAGTTCP